MSGSVIPAQKVAGNMMASAMPWLENRKSVYPASVFASAFITACINPNISP